MKKKTVAAVLAMGMVMASSVVCLANETVDLNGVSLDDIIANAKEEGSVESVGI